MESSLDLEKTSCAVTLSDMELFIFPELLYSLVLANIMSPCIWRWRNDPWFKGFETMRPMKKLQRLKQYIMNTYVFNLDLDTWGLTTKQRETARFRDYFDTETLKQSNALFGYEGDKYYFDIDIRRHFGLDKYDGDVIPYWKTETVEAMNAFVHRPGYSSAAGECVSLATLYAAALFIVAGIPLEDIFLMATPLHSQNFVCIEDGILTNNRRIVTKAMWVNGTEISAKARRALENERVTIVSHNSGHIHTVYSQACIRKDAYTRFTAALTAYLQNDLTPMIVCNFIRHRRDLQKCFQIRWHLHGRNAFIESERVFSYEMHSPFSFTAHTRAKLMEEIDEESFHASPLPSRIVLNDLEEYIKNNHVCVNDVDSIRKLRNQFSSDCLSADIALENLLKFCSVEPRLPVATDKIFVQEEPPIQITPSMEREDIIRHLEALRGNNTTADLAFYAYRDLGRTDYRPFMKAALERNPVSLAAMEEQPLPAAEKTIREFTDVSIYEEAGRLAQPDEVWNYKRGDGLEKAILFANVLHFKNPEGPITITIKGSTATVSSPAQAASFTTAKGLPDQRWDL